jgi:hypothetical protein
MTDKPNMPGPGESQAALHVNPETGHTHGEVDICRKGSRLQQKCRKEKGTRSSPVPRTNLLSFHAARRKSCFRP